MPILRGVVMGQWLSDHYQEWSHHGVMALGGYIEIADGGIRRLELHDCRDIMPIDVFIRWELAYMCSLIRKRIV